ncbi:LCP family protein [Caloramator proteoclasticus]|uniref:Transcriptional attenuator, LytR family n=1 Tax=Caloramator proteoclasticus DSM 10124 TaxID=1121262 RepID=A0A1M4WK27_9CLOT|nr:LCP family protein [Caloramator proteoclasticus]SHE81342.1 transcriptional attenuator, LytR family [Caloramator proteoclasticus DSM 10124]
MKKIWKIVMGVVIIITFGVSMGMYYIESKMNKMDRVELPKSDEELGIKTEDKINENEIINIALFGLDARSVKERSRSDSMIVLTIDKKNKKLKMTSLMRDMYVDIPGRGGDRLNHAYAYGGPALAIKTINSNFGLDIRDFVTINFWGLKDVIDKLGGVQIEIKSYEAKALGLNEGLQILNGEQALAYSRLRYYGHGDYERTERQRRVINEVFKNLSSLSLNQVVSTIETLLPNVQTSMSNTQIISLAKEIYGFKVDSIEEYRLPVDGTFKSQKIRGMAVLVPNIEENKNKLRQFIYNN